MSEPKKTHAQFNYWSRKDAPPFSEIYNIINGKSADMKCYTTEVQDMRGALASFDHSTHGFQVVEHELPTSHAELDFFDPAAVAARYWPDVVSLVKSHLSARSVAVINNAVRKSSSEAHSAADRRGSLRGASAQDTQRASKPFHVVHNDFSPDGARNALRAVVPSFFEDLGSATTTTAEDQELFMTLRREIIDAEDHAAHKTGVQNYSQWDGTRYQGPRWAVFSVWRPLETVRSDPLAVIDATSMFDVPSTRDERSQHYTSIQIPHHDRPGFANYMGNNIMPVLPGAGQRHRWYWVSEQRPEEVLFIKLFDSEAWLEGSRVAPFSAHSAFRCDGQDDSAPRLSIETRVFVIW